MTYEAGISIRGYLDPSCPEDGYRELTLSPEECRLVEERAASAGLDAVEWVVLVVLEALERPEPSEVA